MDLWSILEVWLSGHKLPETAEFIGLSVIWWGRLAKALQFISASFILIDIIGINRFKAGGVKIQNLISWQSIFSLPEFIRRNVRLMSIDRSLSHLQESSEYIYTTTSEITAEGPHGKPLGRITTTTKKPNPNYSEANNLKIRAERERLRNEKEHLLQSRLVSHWVYRVPGICGISFAIYATYQIRNLIPYQLEWILFLILSPIIYYAGSYFLLLCGAIILRLPIFLTEFFILEPIGRILSNERFKNMGLIASYIFLLIGFAVDILTS